MDLGFQQDVRPLALRAKGTADHWTPLEQIWTAEKALKEQGFLALAEHGEVLRAALTSRSWRHDDLTMTSL